MTNAELLDIFVPSTPAKPRDPFNGFGEEQFLAREAEKKQIRKRQRANRALAADPQTPNRATWACVRCHKTIAHGEPLYLHFNPGIMFATLKCASCHEMMATTDPAPFRQATMIREIL